MLNPSTADATLDDPTIRRCINYARGWNFDAMRVVNLFAFRATKPADLEKATDPIGPENDRYLQSAVDECNLVIAAWGAHPMARERGAKVMKTYGSWLSLLRRNKDGSPAHPLYLPKNLDPALAAEK